MTHTPDRMEIEKIEKDTYDYGDPFGGFTRVYDFNKVGDKLNEVIDAVNNLHRRLDEIE